MDTTASLLSPSSSSSSSFTFSPLPSPRHYSCSCSPGSSSCCSPASSASCSFSFSPIPSPSSGIKTSSAFPDLDIASSNSFIWSSTRPLYASSPPLQSPFTRSRPPPLNVSNYAYSTTAEPSQKHNSTHYNQQEDQQQQRWIPLSGPISSPRRTFYTILGVSHTASAKEIRNAYRKLALQYHPDVSPLHQLDTSTKIFAEINEAYSTLSDPQKRACYDLKLALSTPSVPSDEPFVCSPSPRKYTHAATGRVYPSMNSFYREWRRGAQN